MMKNNEQKQICVLDFDDFGEKNHRLDWLWQLRKAFPNFKVNLFAIPNENKGKEWMDYISSIDWIQLCVHGFYHKNNEEVSEKKLKELSSKGFAKVYRAPFWQLSDTMYERLKKLGYKIMIHPEDPRIGVKYNWSTKDSPPFMKTLYGHGHVQNTQGNGIEESFENIMKLPEDTEFKFL